MGDVSVVVREGRMVMYRRSASTPAFWEAHWKSAPPLRMRNQPITPYIRHLVERFLEPKGLTIEAGCGNGNFLRTIQNAGYRIEGLDFEARVIDANRAIDPTGSYLVGDVRALPYTDRSVDGYISLGVVEHFDDRTRALILREAARVLKPCGRAIISVPYFNPLRQYWASLGHLGSSATPDPADFYQYFFTRDEFVGILEAAGLRPLRVDAYDTFKGIKDTVGYVELLNAWKERGPRMRELVENGPRPLRLVCGHMLVVVAGVLAQT
jgi:SAM-dependent methyltransferase